MVVKARGLCPSFIRTDNGADTIMFAHGRFSVFTEAALAEHWPDEEYDSLRITDCYIYSLSAGNVRAEGLRASNGICQGLKHMLLRANPE